MMSFACSMRSRTCTALLALLLLAAYGCVVHYVADYDSSVKNEILSISKKVDIFYGELLETPVQERKYESYKARYIDIETDLRALLVRNEVRPLNRESTKQCRIALDLWIEDKDDHKKNNTVKDVVAALHRKQFTRIFTAMAKGEEAKNAASGEPKDGGN
jgi:hypothetical protein